ncbi:hypothetical protein BSM4216_1021 [Bacillus smithii]|nr:hypothetical protein BSM4216_1021 [Bacillus smithii]
MIRVLEKENLSFTANEWFRKKLARMMICFFHTIKNEEVLISF